MPRPTGRFPPAQRVRKHAEYQEILSGARRVTTARFVLLLRARRDSSGARLGTVVSRKVGGAVVRNRVKRLIREAFRGTRDLWPADIDVVVIPRQARGEPGLDGVMAEWRGVESVLRRRFADARADLLLDAKAGEGQEKAGDSGQP